MKLAITVNSATGRISPVFESAQTLLILQCCRRRIAIECELTLPVDDAQKIDLFSQYELCAVICGAIANETLQYFNERQVRIVPFAAGDWRQVAETFIASRRHLNAKHIMPGCRRHFRQCCQNTKPQEDQL